MEKAVSFTGHRPRKFVTNNQKVNVFNKEFYTKFSEQIYNYLEQLYNKDGYRNFITGGAQGFDQIVFWQVYELQLRYSRLENAKITNNLYIPFFGQFERWKPTGLFGKEKYQEILYVADEIVDCSSYIYQPVPTFKLMHNRNHRMIDDSQLLVACITKEEYTSGNIQGGTSEAITYAKNQNKKINYIVTDIVNNKLNIVNTIGE